MQFVFVVCSYTSIGIPAPLLFPDPFFAICRNTLMKEKYTALEFSQLSSSGNMFFSPIFIPLSQLQYGKEDLLFLSEFFRVVAVNC